MKKLIFTISVVALTFACTESSSKKEFENTQESTNQKTSPTSDQTNDQINPNAFELNLKAFQDCKSSSTNRAQCKEYIAKAVCEYYGITDLKEGGNYVDYDKIPQKLEELSTWEKVGDFTEDNIQFALEQVNSFGKPVLVFNNNDSYVHVVALTPNGNTIKSRKWGNISVPACVSFFPTRAPEKSFISKGVNYAFKSVSGLEIWTKN